MPPRQNHHLTATLCLGFRGERRRSTLANPLQIGAVTTSGAAASSAGKGMGRFGCAECTHRYVMATRFEPPSEGAPSTALRGGEAHTTAPHARRMGPLFGPHFQKRRPTHDFKNARKARRCCFTLASRVARPTE